MLQNQDQVEPGSRPPLHAPLRGSGAHELTGAEVVATPASVSSSGGFEDLPRLGFRKWAGCTLPGTLLLVSYPPVCDSLDSKLGKASGTPFAPVWLDRLIVE